MGLHSQELDSLFLAASHSLIGMGGGLTGQEVAVLQLIVSLMYTIIYKYF